MVTNRRAHTALLENQAGTVVDKQWSDRKQQCESQAKNDRPLVAAVCDVVRVTVKPSHFVGNVPHPCVVSHEIDAVGEAVGVVVVCTRLTGHLVELTFQRRVAENDVSAGRNGQYHVEN